MPGFREFLRSPKGKYIAVAALAVGIVTAIYSVFANMGSAGADLANTRVYVDPKTGQTFRVKMGPGVELPPKAPSGATAVDAEACYWTRDGKVKEEPTYVVLNTYVGKPEPTFCPDCGRLVRGHNPPPVTGRRPPPTKDEFNQRAATADAAGPERR
jgi:hypothetical protein